MFKGRIIGNRRVTGSFEGNVLYEENLMEIYSIKDISIRNGLTINIQHSYESNDYDYNYRIYLINDTGGLVRFIGAYNDSDISHLIEDVSATGIAFISNNSPSGTYKISWLISITDYTLIDNPISTILDIKKLQNWSELGGTVYNWGKERVPEALIKISGEGSFNDSSLDEIKALKIAHQIFDYEKAWSDDIVNDICKRFHLVSYQNELGEECIKSLLTLENPLTTITLYGIKGIVGDIIEPPMSDIYCCPVFNYMKDFATDKFLGQLSVDKVWKSSFSSDYVSGFQNNDGQIIWNMCKNLWNKTRQIEPMPSNLTNGEWVADYNTAIWCLKKILQLMSIKETTLTLRYSDTRKWDYGKHFKLKLPHQTSNTELECVVNEIKKDKYNRKTDVNILFLNTLTQEDEEYLTGTRTFTQEGDYGFIEENNTGFINQ